MAAKRGKSAQPDEESAFLSVGRGEARERITAQIEKGRQILNQERHSAADVASLIEEYRKWNDFNQELLRMLFSGNRRILGDYTNHGFGAMSFGEPGPQEDLRFYSGLTRDAIAKLESIEERLELIPEAPFLHAATAEPSPEALPGYRAVTRAEAASSTRRVFVVHGHDDRVKEAVARFVSQLSIEPIILHEKPNEGKTIIEKFEKHSRGVGFAVILLTPDDKGGTALSDPAKYQPRARQNVILELGYFIGALGRNKVCAIYSQGVELPSDINGVLYIPFDEADGWRLKLAREIKSAGLDVDMNKAI
jgi:predicted nucleotide-binding protein